MNGEFPPFLVRDFRKCGVSATTQTDATQRDQIRVSVHQAACGIITSSVECADD